MTRHRAKQLEDDVISGLRRLAFETENLSFQRNREKDGAQELIQVPSCFHAGEIRLKGDAVEVRFFDRYRAMELLLAIARSVNGGRKEGGLQEALKQGARALAQYSSCEGGSNAL